MAASTFEAVASRIITIFNTEFLVEGFTMVPDNLHGSQGRTRVDVGIAPADDGDVVSANDNVVQETWLDVKFYGLWKQEIKPTTEVSPYIVTAYAERLRNALRAATATNPKTGQLWYFDIRRVRYPNDPTGNKTRFVMTIRAFGNNSGLIETIA